MRLHTACIPLVAALAAALAGCDHTARIDLRDKGEVCLFVYDNGAFIVHSFLPHTVHLDIVLSDGSGPLLDLMSGQTIQGTSREDGTSFPIHLWPRFYRVFKCQQ